MKMEIEFGSRCLWKTQRRGEVIKYSLRFFVSPYDHVFFAQVSLARFRFAHLLFLQVDELFSPQILHLNRVLIQF